jgi:serine protease Do
LFAGCADGSADPDGVPLSEAQQAKSQEASTRTGASRQLPNFTALVEQSGDAVVYVDTIGRAAPGESDESVRDFFERFGIPAPGRGPGGEEPLRRGAGSGFIVSKNGYILTNAHVVAGADEVTVRLTDRREFSAKVVGTDERTDVAVIKIEADELPVVRIGDPGQLQIGEWVLAIGSPFGLENTATAGIVSGTSRALGGEMNVPFIQTDVAVNPGNSGGPLFNLDGEVIGINSMIFSQSGGYMGISFAIPIDVAMNVREQLVKNGRVVRGRIGVVVQNVDAALAKSFQLDLPRGALVASVEEGGPADNAGLKAGDVVLEVNGKAVDRSATLSNTIAALKPGSEAKLTIWRDQKQRQLGVRIAELEPSSSRNARRGIGPSEAGAKLGLSVRPLTQEEKRRTETEGSLVVVNVQDAAARAGLRPGDVILAVNQHEVKSVQELRAEANKLKEGDSAALLVERGDAQIFVPVRVAG